MNDTVNHMVRPREDFSTASFHREAVALQHRFSQSAAQLTKKALRARLWSLPNYLYWSEAPLTDGTMPYGIVYMRTPRGKLAIVLPRPTDPLFEDDTGTDRALTAHFIGEVTIADMIEVSDALLKVFAVPEESAGAYASSEQLGTVPYPNA